nr:hypothetical protein 18 [bacterium]
MQAEVLMEEKAEWLAEQIFKSFPEEVRGLKFFLLNCGCIYYQRILRYAKLDPHTGIYRDTMDGPCEFCMSFHEKWIDRAVDEVAVFRSQLQMEEPCPGRL